MHGLAALFGIVLGIILCLMFQVWREAEEKDRNRSREFREYLKKGGEDV